MSRSLPELEAMLADLESDQVERKGSLSDKDGICQAICAFANDLPDHGTSGVLFVGATDDGQPSGLAITDRLLLELADIRSSGNVLPLPTMFVRRMHLAGGDMAVVEVEPALAPPVRYRGRICIRVGPRRAIASAEEERRLNERRRAADLPFDARPVKGACLDDLDLDMFARSYLPAALSSDVLAANERTLAERLASLRLATLDGEPTVAGVLVLGLEPTTWLPGAYLQFLRIDGVELTDAIKDEKRLDGGLIDVLRQIDELLMLNVETAVDITTASREVRVPDYPLVALQQLTRNALLHRNFEGTNSPVRLTWYDDRVEIFSPGGPFGAVTVENFGQPGVTDYRNPTLADTMRSLGYVQRFGVGLVLARRALADNGNPSPGFNVDSTYVAVTMGRRP